MNTYAIDFESFYSDTLSISLNGVWNYVRDTDVYLVSIVGDDGFEWVGNPKDAPWDTIKDGVWLSHNRSFDLNVALALGLPMPKEWHCTADLCSYLQFPRALAKAIQAVYGEAVSKKVRDDMKGVRWEEVEDKEAVKNYALQDGRLCLRLWKDHSSNWPERERWLSRHTTDMGVRGIAMDLPRLHSGIETLRQKLHEIRKLIPWEGPPTSPKALAQTCRDLGIEPPITTSVKDPRFDSWLAKNAEQAPFVKGIGQYRSTNRLLNGLETMLQFQRDGVLHQPLLYCGAPHTGRWSGGAGEEREKGFNLQNLLKAPLWDVDQRAMLKARDGHVFLTADLAQIEMRVLAFLAGNREMLKLLATGMDPYETHARIFKGYKDPGPLKKVNPKLRQACKAENLGLGYYMGAKRYRDVAASVGITLTEKQAQEAVDTFRSSNPRLVAFWNRLGNVIRNTSDGTIETALPSGRVVRYEGVVFDSSVGENGKSKGWVAQFLKGGPRYRIHAGVFTENCLAGSTQILSESRGWIRLDTATSRDRVWDGVAFVNHSGLATKGLQRTVQLAGVRATPDHRFLGTDGTWHSAEFWLTLRLRRGIYVQDVKYKQGNQARVEAKTRASSGLGYGCEVRSISGGTFGWLERKEHSLGISMRLRSNRNPNSDRGADWQNSRLWARLPPVSSRCGQSAPLPRTVQAPHLRSLEIDAGPMRKPEASGLEELWGPRNYSLCRLGELPKVLRRYAAHLPARIGPGPEGQLLWIPPRQLPLDDSHREFSEQTEHCSAGVGIGQSRRERGSAHHSVLPDSTRLAAPRSMYQARGCSSHSTGGLRPSSTERHFPEGFEKPSTPGLVLRTSQYGTRKTLGTLGRLDSGDSQEKWAPINHGSTPHSSGLGPEDCLHETYDLLDCGPRHCFAVRGGPNQPILIAHNCTQATAREIFAEKIHECEQAGLPVVHHAHDELTVEIPEDRAEEAQVELNQIMAASPSWAPELPLGSETVVAKFYAK